MTLHVQSLHLSHFRSHARTRLEFDHRPVVIHGPNGSGKTNLIEAVSLLSPGRGLRRAAPAELVRQPEALGWRVAATLQRAEHPHEIETGAEAEGPRATRIDGKASPQAALGTLVQMLWLVPAMDRLWTESAEGRRRFLDRMTLSFHPGHGATVLAYEKAMRERNRLLRDQVRDPRWYAALEARMAETGAAIEENREAALASVAGAMSATGERFPVATLALLSNETQPRPPGAAPLAEALAGSRAADLRAMRSLVGPHRADLSARMAAKDMPAAQCSTGEQKALLISVVLANARALLAQGAPAPIILLDEVAAHLDADRRAALFDAVCALGVQAWMTGTGPELFDSIGARAQWCAVSETAGHSQVHRAA